MKNKVILFGDQHVTHEEPFFQVKKDYFQWVTMHDLNNESNIAIFVGDFFHSNEPTPKEYEMVHKFLDRLKHMKDIYILSGNGIHEFNRSKVNWAIDPLNTHKNVTLIKQPEVYNIGNLKILFLPWVPGKFFNDLTMKEWYEDLTEYKDKEFDYIIGHFCHKEFFGHKINISYLNTKNIRMGHVHIPDGEYVGVDTITRYDEKGINCQLNVIDIETKEEETIDIPKFFDFYTIKFGDEVDVETLYFKLDITDAPNKEKVYQKYGNYYIRYISLESEQKDDSDENTVRKFDRNDFITKFIEDKKVKKGVEEKLRSVM